MKSRLIPRLIAVAALLAAGPQSQLSAEEPYLDFVAGLRERGYYDVAEQYLQEITQQKKAPRDILDVVPYEVGVTLRDSARRLLVPEEQRARLDEAQAAFEQFVKAAPNHPLAGRANSERAKMLVEKARVDIWDADGTSDAARQQELRDNARKLINQSRAIFKTAVDQHRKTFESFPGFIPQEERDRLRQREAAEAEYIQSQLDMAESMYWEAQTYPVGNAKRKEILTTAMVEFEKIHTAYRSMIGGLLARLWQGKCLEEMGDIPAALGIYGELLKHEGKSNSMVSLQAKAQQFLLICYNHDSKKEYRLVNQLASDWLRSDANRRARFTETGKGIEWEQARALEQLGQDRTLPENERTTLINQALGIARGLSRRPGPHKAPAAAMVARLTQLLGRDANDPTDFNTAYGRADQLFNQTREITDKIAAAQKAGKSAEARQHADARKGVASEMTRLLTLALRFADKSTDEALLRRSELMLAVGYVYQERPYEAAAVAEYFLRSQSSSPPEMLRLAGEIALAALNDAYQAADEGDRNFEKRQILKLADFLSSRWPETELAVGAHLSAGRLFWDDRDYLAAAQAWLKVPASSKEYGSAQLKAGAALLEQYARQSQLDDAERPPKEQLNQWREDAEKHLQTGVDVTQQKTPADVANPDLLRGKLALAQVRNLEGVYKTTNNVIGAIELLTVDPHSLVKAVQMPPGQARPTDPGDVRSAQFASLVYQQLLRSYIGVKDIEKARDARSKLEQVGAAGDSAALTQIFVQFGQQLQQELEQLRALGDNQRLGDVRTGFEAFLSDLYDRPEDQQTFSSLLWIAETYASLGESAEDDLTKEKEYFDRAASAYQRIITRGSTDAAFLGSPQNGLAVRVRLLECRMRERDYEAAEKVLLEVLKDAPNAPNVQESGARLYQAWAESGDTSKYLVALNGRTEPVAVWGWGELAKRMNSQRGRPELRAIYLDATYHYAQCYQQLARKQTGDERKTSLRNALRVLDTFARTNRDVPDDTYKRLNELYGFVLTDLGETVAPLRRSGTDQPQLADATGTAAGDNAGGRQPLPPPPPPEAEAPPPPSHNVGNTIVVLVILGLGLAAVAGIFVWTTNQAKKKRAARLAAIASSTPRKTKSKPVKPETT